MAGGYGQEPAGAGPPAVGRPPGAAGAGPRTCAGRGRLETRASAAPVPLAIAVATTRAAVQFTLGTTTTAASVSESIAVLLQRELSSMVLVKVTLAALASFAAGVSVVMAVLVVLTLDSPLGRRARGVEPAQQQARSPSSKPPFVPATQLTSVAKTEVGIPKSQLAISGREKVIRDREGHWA